MSPNQSYVARLNPSCLVGVNSILSYAGDMENKVSIYTVPTAALAGAPYPVIIVANYPGVAL